MNIGYHIINSLMDTDWYIFTMAQLFLHKHPTAICRDTFKCRNPKETLFATKTPSFMTTPYYLDWLESEIDHYCTLKFTNEELKWLSGHEYFKPDFIDWLEDFRPKRRYINLVRHDNGRFDITINGPITQQIWFEVPILAIISEIYGTGAIYHKDALEIGRKQLEKNIETVCSAFEMKIADFGTRRRHSHAWQEEVITTFAGKDTRKPIREWKYEAGWSAFVGTSNAYFAMKHNLTPIGTMAHKIICAYQQLGGCRIIDSQKAMFQDWTDEYRGDLGIALSDTLGFDKFLNDFDKYFSKLFDGARHDSGDPYEWGRKLINHYKSMNISPLTKTAIFSDGLTFDKAVKLFNVFSHHIQTSFGVGTKFTNDVGYIAPQIVIKLVECNGNPVAKISDDPAKGMCEDASYIKYFSSLLK